MGFKKMLRIAWKAHERKMRKTLLHPEKDFLYEATSNRAYINRISRKGKSNAGKKA